MSSTIAIALGAREMQGLQERPQRRMGDLKLKYGVAGHAA